MEYCIVITSYVESKIITWENICAIKFHVTAVRKFSTYYSLNNFSKQ